MKKRFNLFSVPINTLSFNDAVHTIINWALNSKNCKTVFTPNPEILLAAYRNNSFCKALAAGDLLLPDGAGLLFASKLLRGSLKEIVTGVDVTEALLKKSVEQRIRVGVILSSEGLTHSGEAKAYFEKYFPHLDIQFFEGDRTYRWGGHIIHDINSFSPDILFVTFGATEQEGWITKRKNKLKSVRVALGVGGAFDMITGTVTRAPYLMRLLYLEWLWRLIIKPSRIKRILDAVILFPLIVFKYALYSRFRLRGNVVAFIFKNKDSILVVHKIYPDEGTGYWILPQGGVEFRETRKKAVLREVHEETGIPEQKLTIVAGATGYHKYIWPNSRKNLYSFRFAGQNQTGHFIHFNGHGTDIRLRRSKNEVFDTYAWASQDEVLRLIKPPRQKFAKALLNEFNERKIYEGIPKSR